MVNQLSISQKKAFDLIANGHNVFITGPAGTGKSYLLRYLKKQYENLHLTASTGIAAINIGGQTLHSWVGIGLGTEPIHKIIQNIMSISRRSLHNKLLKATMLAIDEISMISADIFELLNEVLQIIRGNNKPFGGIQIILFGDFLQLPPVNRDYGSETYFAFESDIWKKANIKVVDLYENFRQDEMDFLTLLNNLRNVSLTKDDIELLRTCYNKKDKNPFIEPTILGTHNKQCEEINYQKLMQLDTEAKTYIAKYDGNKNKIEFLKKNCIARDELTLKIDAQVMMLKNTYSKDGVMNGSIGIVVSFSKKGNPIVEFNNGASLEIKPDIWEMAKWDDNEGKMKIEATMTQMPLLLAYAITCHKSQGMTLDKISCDLKNSFSEGQIYVALSRVKTIEGLYITSFDINKVKANVKVLDFYKNLKNNLIECSDVVIKNRDVCITTEEIREIVFDTETTGLDSKTDRIIEIACIEMINKKATGRVFHKLINPECKISKTITELTGHTTRILKKHPIFSEIVDELLEFISDSQLIAHNAIAFDMKFLNAELERCDKSKLNNSVVDTLQLARTKFGMGKNNLDTLCKKFNIDNAKREKHGALVDSELLVDVYLKLSE